ncbi:exopolysaccharide biosynthesis polyprenyl glycosylphosphotransferase [Kerstersia gyiorum]|uniref:exopolysaccharide biosynthesis polyprenyl glycosylphosphotransferase n=1 Tax=Kerstersia gyiorum TaxID=206506 RepID=UPI00209F519F|nr:exopolysaccharide biosynthesis polyprenyl glycosylphosphotransferase [Kerstersia gyiorum]MCP1636531.1 lipopolysaccharide/colanic/teichoic acid biosynthesis glycosyltransferase [Kerstersia gyiorum]MCP1670216.1 lipopolysaccharide/colanic/teichoic acid biosynthesis glycosyltransferase [Kerstersia gyiorum]MCP1708123.1 lipopolysaccharide/colanic/teichoic acid biosynthesis glycosyltransferase [Kerstersia gyiorum]
MSSLPHRRFGRIHEQLLLSRPFSLLLGWVISIALPFSFSWPLASLLTPDQGQKTTLAVTSIAFVLSNLAVNRLRKIYPGGRSIGFIAPQIIVIYGLAITIALLLRIEVSRFLLVSSGIMALIWLHIEYVLTEKYARLKLAIIPGGKYTEELINLESIDGRRLEVLDLQNRRYDGIVADFSNLTPEVERFLTQCALQHIAVYNARQIYESLTGRVKIHRMSENNIGSLLPSRSYTIIKWLMDIVLVLLFLPLALLIGLITAILIRLESPGPVIYTQTRIGQGCKPFTIYKFRSMRFDRDAPEQFAGEEDPRITRVGRVIRKLRIDELPQFLNILKGDMSLIGPRPEQPSFVQEYDCQIPFYNYRHIVKPGITGWAQVRQGYTASTDETQVKIEHDFYYIKHCSIALDAIIIILTVKIMLTGFGAR